MNKMFPFEASWGSSTFTVCVLPPVPQMNLDEVFLEKGSIASEIKQELTKVRKRRHGW
jgi:hypothetical protein